MLLGDTSVKLTDIERHCSSCQVFLEYADEKVPSEFRHVKAIVNNQRYYHCLLLRQSTVIPWEVKSNIIEEVMRNCKIMGYTNMIKDIRDVYNYIDLVELKKYLEVDNGKGSSRGNNKRM